jgi:hypothetical protein
VAAQHTSNLEVPMLTSTPKQENFVQGRKILRCSTCKHASGESLQAPLRYSYHTMPRNTFDIHSARYQAPPHTWEAALECEGGERASDWPCAEGKLAPHNTSGHNSPLVVQKRLTRLTAAPYGVLHTLSQAAWHCRLDRQADILRSTTPKSCPQHAQPPLTAATVLTNKPTLVQACNSLKCNSRMCPNT